jgi:HTH-type transcriptional regulator/antitoxin HigA
MDIHPIRTDADHAEAVRRIEALWDAAPGTPEDDELDVLATLVDAYEVKRWPIEACTPVEAIRFSMEQNGRSQKDLAELLGSRSRASEILNGRRGLSVEQIKLLHLRWRIPAESLLGRVADA